MASNTWFLPPDFTFLPDGQIALGRIIPDPRRPTATLASVADHPTIKLPEIKSVVEKNHVFAAEKSRTFGLGMLARVLDIANADAKTDLSWYKNKSFSPVDHEVRSYNGPFSPDTLKAIASIDEVKRYMNGGHFGKRCVYIMSAVRVALQSMKITDEQGRKTAVSLGGSGSVPAGAVPIGTGANISGSGQDSKKEGFETAAGIVLSYRLHVIRPKSTVVEAELFTTRAATYVAEARIDDDQEMEAVELNEHILRQEVDAYKEDGIELGDEETYVVVRPTNVPLTA
ncbi:hypothetical protein L249_1409 [Ophiocordyceps polyrhachis-furcata BCC 54312]|uniref:Uncharacterized protein n=1 Tax=Ophiocordyceps polyrhachis-furcata BCC 54312 TaxID=1330021 RepID=A0A367L4U9_9HYPO|nr:hypothetical protein L249_1409 [Ophiocordyceps polyrhachis-furcata BCC 54312]